MSDANPDALLGTWRHSYEEEGAGALVYRPRGYDLPPSRGRGGLEFRSDGTFRELTPGADDRGAAFPGTWRLEPGATLELQSPNGRQRYKVLDASRSVLRLRRVEE